MMLHKYRLLMVAVFVASFFVGSTTLALARSMIPANQYDPVTVQVSSQCPNAQTIVNLPINPTQIQSIIVSGSVNGPIHLFDKNGSINVTGSAPYSFTITVSDVLQACVAGSGTGTVSFQGQLNMAMDIWTGYAVEGFSSSVNTYTWVTAGWQIPSVTCHGLLDFSDSATWIGLGGALLTGSSTIQQIGTSQYCNAGTPVYKPVYENFYQGQSRPTVIIDACPDNSSSSYPCPKQLQFAPQPNAGDLMYAEVYARGGGNFYLFLHDYTQKWRADEFTTQTANSAQYSAEWIEEFEHHESVSVLAQFTPVQFTTCLVDGHPITLGGPSIQQLTMQHKGGSIMAQSSGLTGSGDSFTASFVHSLILMSTLSLDECNVVYYAIKFGILFKVILSSIDNFTLIDENLYFLLLLKSETQKFFYPDTS